MSNGYLIGVDIGTYSSKGVLVRTDGVVIASHTLPHGLDMPRPGFFEHDADRVWWHDFVVIIKSLFQQTGLDPKQVLGIGTSAIGSCVLPIDEMGRPLRAGILYGIDTRATAEINYLERNLSKIEPFQASGLHLDSQASGPKILWIRNQEPEVCEKTRWFEAAARLITPLEHLPRTYWSYEVVGQVTAEAAAETGLAAGTPVVAGTTDAAAEAISAGVADFGDMMLMFGSSIFFIMKTAGLVQTRHFWSSNFLEEGAYAFLGGMSTSGSLTTWFRDQFAQFELAKEKEGQADAYAELVKLASASPIGSKGLITLPYFEGERTPLHDPKARGVWFGLSLKHTKGDIYRAILEGVAFGIRHNFEVMGQEGVQPQRILAVGGGTKNPLWLQIVADVCQLELTVPEQQIGASYGDAFLAGMGIGLFKGLSEIKQWVKTKEMIKPNRESGNMYEVNYQIFRELYPSTKTLMHKLADHVTG
jgi:xylulokinase